MLFATLGRKHPSDSPQIKWIGDQRIQGIARYCDDFATADCGGSPFNGLRLRLLGIDFDQVSGHDLRFRDFKVSARHA